MTDVKKVKKRFSEGIFLRMNETQKDQLERLSAGSGQSQADLCRQALAAMFELRQSEMVS